MFSYNYNACPLRSGCELTGSGRAGRPGSPPRLEGPLCFPLAGEAERVFLCRWGRKNASPVQGVCSSFRTFVRVSCCGMKKLFTSTTFLAVICCVLWASPFVPLKIGLDIMPRPLEFAGYRFFLAGFFLFNPASIV